MKGLSTIWIFLFLLTPGLLHAQNNLAATFDLCTFRATDTSGLFEYYLSFDGRSLNYIQNSDGKYQSTVEVFVKMFKGEDPIFADRYKVNSPAIEDSVEMSKDFLVQNRIFLPYGEYNFSFEAKDLNASPAKSETDSKASFLIPIKLEYDPELIQISDIQNLKDYSKAENPGPNSKHGFNMISRNSNFFPESDNEYKFFAEVYNADRVLGKGQPYLVSIAVKKASNLAALPGIGSFKKYTAQPATPILGAIDLSKVPSGNFYISLEVKNKENQTLYSKRKFFQRSNPSVEVQEESFATTDQNLDCEFGEMVDERNLDLTLQALYPLATQRENDFIDALVSTGTEEDKLKYLCYFFKKRETEVRSALSLFIEYQDRLEVAEKKYRTQTMPGYQTDRGRVLIQYGKPNRIDDEFSDMTRQATNNAIIPYEKWIFYKVDFPIPQTNIEFVFAQQSRADYNYRLVHSTAVGEVSNPNWKNTITAPSVNNPTFTPGLRD